ncbi:leukotriene A4 hydrolase C-terminal domain-containing protein [Hymenobacter sp. AT01-02]|uniref:leukotriene A4 hydrolase C-terminal domain-containing protein n=1 Tax=Hymenobacter sp. AT01-02 TaxID=1571877 RepID=UPI002934FCFD|nr:leukotriene A4 hydrolase C-terminal domain-containing protein [Hymenobacter sp. AT01-02]
MLAAWFPHTIAASYSPADEALQQFLIRVGRRKFLVPLYKGLLAVPGGPERARRIYAQARPNYHAVATVTFDALLGYPAEA